ncbi:hypothetical protein DFH09DRAFT_1174944 [Mycena vulgaris]|nr:hypothetical protein DFH09DRAFT_1174944 [Mycena vulgaris]
MPPPASANRIQSTDIIACLNAAVGSLGLLTDAVNTPFLDIMASTTLSLLACAQNVKHRQEDFRGELSPNLLTHIAKFAETLHKIHTFVEAQQGGSRIKRFFRQGEMAALLKDCNAGLQQALDGFKVGLQADINHVQSNEQKRHQEVLELIDSLSDGANSSNTSLVCGPLSSSFSMLPSVPKIFHGREAEVSHVLKLFTQGTPRIAISGVGGIGKTSLARTILHHPDITAKFDQHRFFVPCDSVPTTVELIALIGSYLGLKPGKDLTRPVLHYFSSSPPSLLILDNLEKLWEPSHSRGEVEEFLSLITDVPLLALIITLRGAERPAKVSWTRPFLPPLMPLRQNAARQTFIDIADDAPPVGCNLPLTIDLMAHLVDYEGCPKVLARWETERTSMLSQGYDKSSNLNLSISLSLSSDQITSALVPIREYMHQFYPPGPQVVFPLLCHFHGLLHFDRLTPNLANIYNILTHDLYKANPHIDMAIKCTMSLDCFTVTTGRGPIVLIDHIADILPSPSDHKLEAQFIVWCFESWKQCSIINVGELVNKAVDHFKHFNDPNMTCHFFNVVGNYYLFHENDLVTAMNFYQKSLKLSHACDNMKRQADTLYQLACIKAQAGDYATAQAHASESGHLARISANLYREARSLRMEARCSNVLGNYTHSMNLCKQARVLLHLCGMTGSEMDYVVMRSQSEVHSLKSEYVDALNIQTELFHKISVEDAPSEHAFALLNLADINVAIGAPMHFIQQQIDTAKALFDGVGYSKAIIYCDTTLADLNPREGNLLAAKTQLQQSLKLFWAKDDEIVTYCLERLGDVSRWGSEKSMSRWTVVFLGHVLKSKQKSGVYKALQFLGHVFMAEGPENTDTASSLFTVALTGFNGMDIHQNRAECMLQLGDLARQNGDLMKALALWKTARSLFERSSQAKKISCIDERLSTVKC